MGLKSFVCMECRFCSFFVNVLNRVNFQDAGICSLRKHCNEYSSGAAFNNSAVRPQSSDALLNFLSSNCLHQVCLCPWRIQHRRHGKFDGCAGFFFCSVSSMKLILKDCLLSGSPWVQFFFFFSPAPFWSAEVSEYDDVTFEFANSGFCGQLVFQNVSMSSTLLVGWLASCVLPLWKGKTR